MLQHLTFGDWLSSLSMVPSGFFCVVAGVRLSFLFKIVRLRGVDGSRHVYPLTRQWTPGLLPLLGRHGWRPRQTRMCACLGLSPCFHFLWVWTQRGDCWVMGLSKLDLLRNPRSFSQWLYAFPCPPATQWLWKVFGWRLVRSVFPEGQRVQGTEERRGLGWGSSGGHGVGAPSRMMKAPWLAWVTGEAIFPEMGCGEGHRSRGLSRLSFDHVQSEILQEPFKGRWQGLWMFQVGTQKRFVPGTSLEALGQQRRLMPWG